MAGSAFSFTHKQVEPTKLAPDKLNLSQKECNELVAFIKALDSKG